MHNQLILQRVKASLLLHHSERYSEQVRVRTVTTCLKGTLLFSEQGMVLLIQGIWKIRESLCSLMPLDRTTKLLYMRTLDYWKVKVFVWLSLNQRVKDV